MLVGGQPLGGRQRRDGGVRLAVVQRYAIKQCLVVRYMRGQQHGIRALGRLVELLGQQTVRRFACVPAFGALVEIVRAGPTTSVRLVTFSNAMPVGVAVNVPPSLMTRI